MEQQDGVGRASEPGAAGAADQLDSPGVAPAGTAELVPAPPGAEPTPGLPIGVGAIVGATIDTYAATLPRLLLVVVPYAVVFAIVPSEAPWPLLMSLAWPLAAGYVIRVAGDHVRGERRSAGDALAASGARSLVLLGWSLLVGVALIPVVLLAGIAIAAADAVGVGGEPIALLAIVSAVAVAGLALLARWSVAPPAVVLDDEGPLSGNRRSVDLVRGRTAAVSILVLLGGLTSAIPAAATLLPFAFAEVGEVVAIVIAASLLAVAFPLLPIGATVLYARLDGSAVRTRPQSPARGAVISAMVAASLALGLAIAVLGGVGLSGEAASAAARRGTVQFGSSGTECAIEDPRTTFAVGDVIHLAATLERSVPAGGEIDVRVLLGGELVDEASNAFAEEADCIYGSVPTDALPPGRYTLEYAADGEVLASGEFDLVAP